MLPAVSSTKLLTTLLRLGCVLPRPARGSHQVVRRDTGAQRFSTVVVLGQKEVHRDILRANLKQLNLSEAEFVAALR